LYDYWGGSNDLKKGIIRVLHSLSFVDDPTRMLRAIRFEQRFGFSIEERTLELLDQAKDLLDDVSGDRVRHELDQILTEERTVEMFNRLAELNLLGHILPAYTWNTDIAGKLSVFLITAFPPEWNVCPEEKEDTYRVYGAYIILLVGLSGPALKGVLSRLRFKNHLRKMLIEANRLWMNLEKTKKLKPSQVSRQLDSYSLLAIYCVFFLAEDSEIREMLENYALRWRKQKPFITGTDLKNLGIKPGSHYREILEKLRFAWVDGEINSREQEKAELNRLLEKYPSEIIPDQS